jgi:predicted transcriptional regulator
MENLVKINEEFTTVELAHILDALTIWEKKVNQGIDELNDDAEKGGQVCLFGRGFGSTLIHDIKIKLNLDNTLKDKGIFKINE